MLQNQEARLKEIHVLVVDDDKAMRDVFNSVLQSLGFTNIHLSTDGAGALDIMREQHIDLILCDWVMQPMDGINFIQYLRRDPDSPNPLVPIIMITGKSSVNDVRYARDSGINEYLSKPFTVHQLCDRLAAVIEQPRDFVVAKEFRGPDRRRKKLDAFIPEERRDEMPERISRKKKKDQQR